jgi:FAD/FMN-containing dehydrogenase
MDSAVNDGQVALRHVPAMTTEDYDEDVAAGTHHTRRLSLEGILLGEVFPARCTRVRYMLDSDSSEALGIVSAIEFTFGAGRPLFFGAMNTYGLQPGTWGAYDHHVGFWRPRLPDVTEHVWTR